MDKQQQVGMITQFVLWVRAHQGNSKNTILDTLRNCGSFGEIVESLISEQECAKYPWSLFDVPDKYVSNSLMSCIVCCISQLRIKQVNVRLKDWSPDFCGRVLNFSSLSGLSLGELEKRNREAELLGNSY